MTAYVAQQMSHSKRVGVTQKKRREKKKEKRNSPDLRAPLRIPAVRAQVRHHDGDALTLRAPRAAGAARCVPGRRQVVAGAAARAAPRAPVATEEGLRPGRCIDARRGSGLPGEGPAAGAAAAGSFEAVIVALDMGEEWLLVAKGLSLVCFFFWLWRGRRE